MKIRLHEIELGSNNPEEGKKLFADLLGLHLSLDQENLKVIDPGIKGLDFNLSTHLLPGTVAISFLCDDLEYVITVLKQNKIPFSAPEKSHLGMLSIRFNDASGNKIRVNAKTSESPDWLVV
jgi:hypothetical protein